MEGIAILHTFLCKTLYGMIFFHSMQVMSMLEVLLEVFLGALLSGCSHCDCGCHPNSKEEGTENVLYISNYNKLP